MKAFTLAEVLITLAIIGVVAAISIPSVISNSQQQEFKTGLRKAVSVLNSAITMNMAIDGESPYDNADTFRYLQRHMSILKSTVTLPYETTTVWNDGTSHYNSNNAAFYTTDGMRYEFNMTSSGEVNGHLKLHESDIMVCEALHPNTLGSEYSCGGCGSYGMIHNPNNTTKPPCLIIVDVNGDKKPTPANIYCGKNEDGSGRHDGCAKEDNRYKVPLPGEKKVRDIFSILITEDRAIPYGVTAQKAMYNSQK